ncbi:MAG: LON peptidase substrate-binding domain-containing protein, partial [Eubacteriales bacterium]
AVNAAAENGTELFIAAQKNALVDTPSKADLNRYGVVARVTQIIKLPGGSVKVSVEALYRAYAENIRTENGMFRADTVREDYIEEEGTETEAYFRLARQAMLEYTLFDKQLSKDVLIKLSEMSDPNEFIDNVLSVLTFKESRCQALLEERVTTKRLAEFTKLLTGELEISKIERKISAQVRKNIDKGQKEFYLREQLKAIHSELGDDEDEKKTLLKEIKDKRLPAEVEEKALKELARLDKINPSSPDYSIILNYLDWIKELPFNTVTEDAEDLTMTKAVLDADVSASKA